MYCNSLLYIYQFCNFIFPTKRFHVDCLNCPPLPDSLPFLIEYLVVHFSAVCLTIFSDVLYYYISQRAFIISIFSLTLSAFESCVPSHMCKHIFCQFCIESGIFIAIYLFLWYSCKNGGITKTKRGKRGIRGVTRGFWWVTKGVLGRI